MLERLAPIIGNWRWDEVAVVAVTVVLLTVATYWIARGAIHLMTRHERRH